MTFVGVIISTPNSIISVVSPPNGYKCGYSSAITGQTLICPTGSENEGVGGTIIVPTRFTSSAFVRPGYLRSDLMVCLNTTEGV